MRDEVNARLKEEEAASHTGDPKFPKVQWPPQSICPSCSTVDNATGEIDWDLDSVYAFSTRYYSTKQDVGRSQRDDRQQQPALRQKCARSRDAPPDGAACGLRLQATMDVEIFQTSGLCGLKLMLASADVHSI
ncbi:Sulfhydryl oxidase 1 [Cymbomonas tetramitiformis]|uniref:Sulfhydryl oxidase 1 n=1 Tax=Cymbomonas tetramitiformis TaxID=36881 RepID=A0AAE0BJ05_9CHLO|nr:Sulfhydryl oxidase 1 [Cymbomonas tetramitiformis]